MNLFKTRIFSIFSMIKMKANFFLLLILLFCQNVFSQVIETELDELVINTNNAVKEDLLNIIKNSEKHFSHQDQQLEFKYLVSQNNELLEAIQAVFKFKKLGGRIYDPKLKWSEKIYKNDKYSQFLSTSIFTALMNNCAVLIDGSFNSNFKDFIENSVVEKEENTYTVYHPNNSSVYTIIKTDSTHQWLTEIKFFGISPIIRLTELHNEKAYFKTTYSFKEGKYLIENITARCTTNDNDSLNILFNAKKNTLSKSHFSEKKTILGFLIFYNNKKNEFLYSFQ